MKGFLSRCQDPLIERQPDFRFKSGSLYSGLHSYTCTLGKAHRVGNQRKGVWGREPDLSSSDRGPREIEPDLAGNCP